MQKHIIKNPKYFCKFFQDKKSQNMFPSNVNCNSVNTENGQDIFSKFFLEFIQKLLSNKSDVHYRILFCININLTLADIF